MQRKYIVFLFITFFIGFVILSIIKYIEMKPFMSNLFSNADNLVYNQKLTDSVIFLIDEHDNRIELSLKDSVHLNFFSLNKINLIHNIDEKFYNIETNSKSNLRIFKEKNKITARIYKCDTSYLPFKYKKIDLPYKLKIFNYKIVESEIYN